MNMNTWNKKKNSESGFDLAYKDIKKSGFGASLEFMIRGHIRIFVNSYFPHPSISVCRDLKDKKIRIRRFSLDQELTLYLTTQPCLICSKEIVKKGICRVFFDNEIQDKSGINYLKSNNIEVYKEWN